MITLKQPSTPSSGAAPGAKARSLSQFVTSVLDDGKQKNPIYVLDGIRAIACLSVLTFHINLAARDYGFVWQPIHDFGSLVGALALFGQSGVILFFLLSGFLLFLPYAKALLFQGNWPSLRQFYIRRIFRIVPAYYVALFAMILLFNREYLQPANWHNLWLFLTFRMDFPQTYQQIDGPFWTLAVEFQFYILLPLLAWVIGLVVRRGKPAGRMLRLVLCLLALMGWGWLSLYWGRVWSQNGALNGVIPPAVTHAISPYIYGSSGKYLEVFAVGMLICAIYVYLQQMPQESRWNCGVRRWSPLTFVVGLAILLFMSLWHFYTWYFNYTMHFFDPIRNLLVYSWDQWQSVLYALCFGLCMFALLYAPRWLKRPFEIAPLRWIGLISFSLYMWHDPLIAFYMKTFSMPLQAHGVHRVELYVLLLLFVLLIVIPISLASYLLIEKPGMRLGELLRRRVMPAPSKPATQESTPPPVETSAATPSTSQEIATPAGINTQQ